jgi:hypothetical protein
MGKKNGSSMQFARARAGVAASRGAYRQDRMAGFRATNDIQDAIFGNLNTTMRGVGRTLTSSNAKQLRRIQQMAKKSAAGNERVIGNARGTAANLYGIAGVAGAKPALDAAAAAARGSEKAMQGQVKGAKTQARTAQTVLGIMQAGVQEARAGAKAQTADALAYRAKEDATLIAGQQLELQKMRLQAQLDLDTYKKKLAMDEKAAAGGSTGITTVATFGVQAFPALREAFNADPEATPQSVASDYITKNNITDPNAITLINQLASSMAVAGAGPQNKGSIAPGEVQSFVTGQLTDTLELLYPNYSKHSKEVEKMLKAQLSVYAAETAAQQLAGADDRESNVGYNADRSSSGWLESIAAWLPETTLELLTAGTYASQTYDSK